MTKRPSRLPITALATALFLVITFNSSPSNPSVPHPSQPAPSRAEVARIREMQRMAGWVAGAPHLKVLRDRDLDAALDEGGGDFNLFRSAEHPAKTPKEAPERRLLAGLPFGDEISQAADRNRVDGLLIAAVVETESSFSPRAVSPRGAMGLMQVMPGTGRDHDAGDLFDPDVNLDVGSRYLGSLIEHYDGDLELALAAYNAGPATVARYGGIPPYQETRDYVERVLARYLVHQQSVASIGAGEGSSAPRRGREANARRPAVARAAVTASAASSVAPAAAPAALAR